MIYPPTQKLYTGGYPFSAKLAYNLSQQEQRVESNKASAIIIDGGVGSGKTTMAVHIADFYEKRVINPEEHIGQGGEHFMDKLAQCIAKGFSTCIYDEAGDFNKRGALTKFNNMMNRIFEKYRAMKIKIIIVLPSMSLLDNTIFINQIPRGLIHMERKTGASSADFSAYNLYRAFYLKKQMKDIVVSPQAYKIVKPNFYGHVHDLCPERALILDRLSTTAKKDDLTSSIIKGQSLKTPSEIAKEIGRSKVWVNNKIKEMAIAPNINYRTRRYFNTSTIEVLKNEV